MIFCLSSTTLQRLKIKFVVMTFSHACIEKALVDLAFEF